MIQYIYDFETQCDNKGRYVDECISLDTDTMLFTLERRITDPDGNVKEERVSMAHTTVQVILQAAALKNERHISNG